MWISQGGSQPFAARVYWVLINFKFCPESRKKPPYGVPSFAHVEFGGKIKT